MQFIEDNECMDAWNKFIHDGSMDCLSRVYYHFYDHLFEYGMRFTSDKYAIEDAIQNGFVNFIKGRKNLGTVINLPGYLFSTFRRQLLLDLNKQKKIVNSNLYESEQFKYFRDSEPDNEDSQEYENVLNTIKDCMSKLTDKQKEILYLRFEKEISYEIISEMLNISVDSCYKSLYRSIKAIRTEVKQVLGEVNDILLFFMLKHR